MKGKGKQAWNKREVLAYLDRILSALDKLDHFEILDLAHDADSQSIQNAFHSMAGRLHPDRHRNSLAPDQYEQLIVAYARIAEAYRVLRQSELRTAYLRKLGRERKTDSPLGPVSEEASSAALALLSIKAQQQYRRSVAAMRTGDSASAVLNLRMALAKHPQSDFLKAALRNLQKSQ